MHITDCRTFGVGGRNFIFVKLTTNDGLVGCGETYCATFDPYVVARTSENMAARFVIGADLPFGPHGRSTVARGIRLVRRLEPFDPSRHTTPGIGVEGDEAVARAGPDTGAGLACISGWPTGRSRNSRPVPWRGEGNASADGATRKCSAVSEILTFAS